MDRKRMSQATDLNIKRVVWITGASSGIGAATAKRLANDGWHVAITARSADKLAALQQSHRGLYAYAGDVTDPAAMTDIVARIEQDLGPIDLAIMNAGNYFPDTVEDFSAASLKQQYEINVFGTMNALEPVLQRFKARQKGHIAIVASVAGYRGLPRSLSYGSSKAALINFTEALAAECRFYGIKVQLVCPGFVKTPLTDKNDFPMPMLMDVDVAAEKFVQGLQSNRFEITFPWAFACLTKLVGLLPGGLYIAAIAKIKQRQLASKK
jgi:short-subunit dehydrogenase